MHEARVSAVNRVLAAVLAGAIALGLFGCGSARPKSRSAAVIGRPQAGVLRLAAGRSAAQFTIVAPPPPKYTWNVLVSTAATADVAVNIHTWYGVDLQVLPSTREADSCKTSGARSTCFLRFPLLEAQRAGRWMVIASKRSGPSATVHIAITFHRPKARRLSPTVRSLESVAPSGAV